ncbi:PaaI family thioesterase [soil metagenome]
MSTMASAARTGAPIDAAVLAAHRGIDILHKLMAGELPPPPFMELLDFELVEVEPGIAVFAGTPQRMHYNPIGSVHGGYHATLLDSCMGCAVHTAIEAGEGYTTIELKLNYIRAPPDATGPIRAEGKIITRTRQIATAEGRIVDSNGKLYAHGTTTCLIFPACAGV